MPVRARDTSFSYLVNGAERIHHWHVAARALAEWLIGLNDDSALASRRFLSRLERACIGPDDGLATRQLRDLPRASVG